MYFQPIYHSIASCIYISMSVWEIYTATVFTKVESITDVARCFVISIAIVNIGLGVTSTYVAVLQCSKEERPDKLVLNAATGVSLWGIIMYFRYPMMLEYQNILLAETTLFFIRIALTFVLMCGSYIKIGELQSTTVEMNN